MRADPARAWMGRSTPSANWQHILAALDQEPASLRQLLSPGLRSTLWIGVVLAVLQQTTGINVFLYYAPEIFKTVAGSDADVAMMQTVVIGAVNLGFTVLAIGIVDKVGASR